MVKLSNVSKKFRNLEVCKTLAYLEILLILANAFMDQCLMWSVV